MLTAILLVQMDLISEALAADDLQGAAREAAAVRELIRGWVG